MGISRRLVTARLIGASGLVLVLAGAAVSCVNTWPLHVPLTMAAMGSALMLGGNVCIRRTYYRR
jgi:hypothetical protein